MQSPSADGDGETMVGSDEGAKDIEGAALGVEEGRTDREGSLLG